MEGAVLPLTSIKKLHIELGYFCNIRCIMCYQKNFTERLPDVVWKRKLLPIYPTLEEINIQGGELTVIPEARELISLVKTKNKNIRFSAMTNGMMFDDYWQKEFTKNGFMVNFSINAASAKMYEIMAKGSNYEKVISNLRSLIKMRNLTGSNLKICTSFVVRPENVNEISDFISFGREMGVDSVRFYLDMENLVDDCKLVEKNVGRAWRNYQDSEVYVEGLASFYQYYCFVKKIENKFSEYKDNSMNWGKCMNPWNEVYVNHTGDVRVCCNTTVLLGNLVKGDEIDIIWNGSGARKIRKSMASKNFCYCRPTCPYVENLEMGWSLNRLRQKIEVYGDKFKHDPVGSMTKVLPKIGRKLQLIKF